MTRHLHTLAGLASALVDVVVGDRHGAGLRLLHQPRLRATVEVEGLRRASSPPKIDADALRQGGLASAESPADHPSACRTSTRRAARGHAARRPRSRSPSATKPGRPSAVTSILPITISIFEVDPRGSETDKGLGPAFYKEWKVTVDGAGDRPVAGAAREPQQKVTLVLHGRGNACTELSSSSPTGRCSSMARPASSLSMGLSLPPRASQRSSTTRPFATVPLAVH